MGLPVRDFGRHTYAEYCRWPSDRRHELIDGVAYLLPPSPSVRHQTAAFEIATQIRIALQARACRVFVAPTDVLLPAPGESDDDCTTVVQPDVLIVCDRAKIREKHIRGAPDLVVEVLSPSTAGHDQILKRATYERAGVQEYWLVHPTDRVLTIYRLDAGKYGAPDIRELKGETAVGAVPEVVLQWDPIVAMLGTDD